MVKECIEHRINAPLEIVAHTNRQTIIKLNNKQEKRREYTLKLPASPEKNSLLEEIMNAVEQKKDVRFRGVYIERPTSYFAYIIACLNLLLFISPRSTLKVFKKYSYEGEISVGRKKELLYKLNMKVEDPYFPGYPTVKIEKINATLLR